MRYIRLLYNEADLSSCKSLRSPIVQPRLFHGKYDDIQRCQSQTARCVHLLHVILFSISVESLVYTHAMISPHLRNNVPMECERGLY